ncbi:MAG: TIGR03936 family radical SAM-associated protein [Sporomusaceae bacterium]|nr:TIGR03936 family radical SAM-associated protein [Sporomusaceae bacterium]
MFLRAAVTKGEQVRYISHLDFARTLERGLRRAQLPVAYSEGFNPHIKLSFASALSVGSTGLREYVDVELTEDIAPAAFCERLTNALPDGIAAGPAAVISQAHKALMAVINYATYTVEMPLAGAASAAAAAIESFLSAERIEFTRQSPKGRREIDLKQFVDRLNVRIEGDRLLVSFAIAVTAAGSAKASEVITILCERFALPAASELALIRRDGLWVKQGDELLSPLELRG